MVKRFNDFDFYTGENNPTIFRFNEKAQDIYIDFVNDMKAEALLKHQFNPLMQSHIAKMDKTIISLSLIFELVDSDGSNHQISEKSIIKAVSWFAYLISHAEKIYGIDDCKRIEDIAKIVLNKKTDIQKWSAENSDGVFSADWQWGLR